MKTAEEYVAKYMGGNREEVCEEAFSSMEDLLERVQLDAWKAGMLEAVSIANQFADYDPSRDGRVIGREILRHSERSQI